MRTAYLFAAATAALGLGLMAQPAAAHPYGPEDEHVNPGSRHGDSDNWGSGGSPGYYADGRYYSSYPHRKHRRYRGYRSQSYGRYGQPPAYGYGAGQGSGAPGGYQQTYPSQSYPSQGYQQRGSRYGQGPNYGPAPPPPYPGDGSN